jgi:hypothetical protein
MYIYIYIEHQGDIPACKKASHGLFCAPPPPSRVADSFSSILALQHGGWVWGGGGSFGANMATGILKEKDVLSYDCPGNREVYFTAVTDNRNL